MATLNNKRSRAHLAIKNLYDDFYRRAKGIEHAFPEDSKILFEEIKILDTIIKEFEDNPKMQNSCNVGDKYERFNKK